MVGAELKRAGIINVATATSVEEAFFGRRGMLI